MAAAVVVVTVHYTKVVLTAVLLMLVSVVCVDGTVSVLSQDLRLSAPSSIKDSTSVTPTSEGCSELGFTSQRTRPRVTSTCTESEEGRAARCTKTAPATSATGTPHGNRV